jgi:cobalt-zinc-cadmium efflux system membrane fusion protein
MKVLYASIFLFAFAACSSRSKHEETAEHETKPESKLLEMSTQAQRHVGLQTTTVVFKQLQEYLRVVGTVQPIDTHIGHVRSLARGRVQQIRVRVGDRVGGGEALATFDNIEAGEVLAEYRGAVAELQRVKLQQASAQRISERNRELSDLGAIAKKNAELSQVEVQSAGDSVRVQESVVAGLVSRLRRLGVEQVNVTNPTTFIRAPFAGVVIKAQTPRQRV